MCQNGAAREDRRRIDLAVSAATRLSRTPVMTRTISDATLQLGMILGTVRRSPKRRAEAIPRAVVLVEGVSDQLAVETLARRRGHDLVAEGVSVMPMGGSKNITSFLDRFGPGGLNVTLAGLCDEAEEADFRRGLERAGLRVGLTRADLEALGFYVCVADLEDELIRALGTPAVLRIIEEQDELGPLRTFQQQPFQRERTIEQQLRRFMGTRGGRKVQYATLLVDALDPGRVPRPLDGVLAHVIQSTGGAGRT